jgi:hypothetical protein
MLLLHTTRQFGICHQCTSSNVTLGIVHALNLIFPDTPCTLRDQNQLAAHSHA